MKILMIICLSAFLTSCKDVNEYTLEEKKEGGRVVKLMYNNPRERALVVNCFQLNENDYKNMVTFSSDLDMYNFIMKYYQDQEKDYKDKKTDRYSNSTYFYCQKMWSIYQEYYNVYDMW